MIDLPQAIKFTLTDKEILRAGRKSGLLQSKIARNGLLTLLMMICAITFFQQYIIPATTRPNYPLGVFTLAVTTFATCAVWLGRTKAERQFLAKALKSGEISATFSDEIMKISSADGTVGFLCGQPLDISIIYADDIICIIQREEKHKNIIIPKTATDEQNYERINRYLKEKIKPINA